MSSVQFSGESYPQAHPGQPLQDNQYTGQPTYVIQGTPVQQIYISNKPYLNFTGAIVFSCIVYWCCGGLFGLIAFILAMIGQSSAASGDDKSAKSLLVGSYIMSAIGVVAGIILIVVLSVLSAKYFKNGVVETSYEIKYKP